MSIYILEKENNYYDESNELYTDNFNNIFTYSINGFDKYIIYINDIEVAQCKKIDKVKIEII